MEIISKLSIPERNRFIRGWREAREIIVNKGGVKEITPEEWLILGHWYYLRKRFVMGRDSQEVVDCRRNMFENRYSAQLDSDDNLITLVKAINDFMPRGSK